MFWSGNQSKPSIERPPAKWSDDIRCVAVVGCEELKIELNGRILETPVSSSGRKRGVWLELIKSDTIRFFSNFIW